MKTVIFTGLDGNVTLEVLSDEIIESRISDGYYGDDNEVIVVRGRPEVLRLMSESGVSEFGISLDEQDNLLIVLD